MAPHHINGLAEARAVADMWPTLPTMIIRIPCEQTANSRRWLDFVEDRLDHGVHDLIRAEDIPRLRAIAQGNRTIADAPVLIVIAQRVPDLPAGSTVLVQVDDWVRPHIDARVAAAVASAFDLPQDAVLPFDFNSTTVAPDGPGHIQAELLMPPSSLPLPPPYQYLEEFVNQEGWAVDDVQFAGLAKLAEARDELVGARDKLTALVSDIGDDLLLGGAVTEDVPLLSGDFKAALARVLKLPEGMELPKDFESPFLAPAMAGRERIHGELINFRADLAALRWHVEEQWLPWANDRLSSPGVIGDQILEDME